jgi:hypothetical protein
MRVPPFENIADQSATQRVRCRQIVESDMGALTNFLLSGFPYRTHEWWGAGLDRLMALPPVEGIPRFGYVLESENGIVGVLLTISSRRGQQVVSNVSGWYVHPSYRAHSTLLVSVATKLKDVIYLNASPAPHTWPTLQASGWKRFNSGRSAAIAVLGFGGGKVHEAVPDDLPERALLEDHRAWGCTSLVCEKGGLLFPFVFKPQRVSRARLRMMELIYCRTTTEFERCGPALGRYFLRRGYAGFILDGKVTGMVSRYADGKEPRFYKGPRAPELNDLAYTEKLIFA